MNKFEKKKNKFEYFSVQFGLKIYCFTIYSDVRDDKLFSYSFSYSECVALNFRMWTNVWFPSHVISLNPQF